MSPVCFLKRFTRKQWESKQSNCPKIIRQNMFWEIFNLFGYASSRISPAIVFSADITTSKAINKSGQWGKQKKHRTTYNHSRFFDVVPLGLKYWENKWNRHLKAISNEAKPFAYVSFTFCNYTFCLPLPAISVFMENSHQTPTKHLPNTINQKAEHNHKNTAEKQSIK